MLIVSELSEALEADRKNRRTPAEGEERIMYTLDDVNDERFQLEFATNIKDRYEDELADVLIRLLDVGMFDEIDLLKHAELKHRYNLLRSYKHNKLY